MPEEGTQADPQRAIEDLLLRARPLVANGDWDAARSVVERLRALSPAHPATHNLAGVVLEGEERLEEAAAAFRQAVQAAPGLSLVWLNLARVLRGLRRYEEARDALREALRLDPERPAARHDLGVVLHELGDGDAAVEELTRAAEAAPDSAALHYDLGLILTSQAELARADACLQRALQLAPNDPDTHMSLGNVRRAQGRVREAIDCYREALRAAPDHRAARSNLLLALHYEDDYSPREILDEHRRWARQHATPSERPARRRAPEERLRVAYVSPDLRAHSVSFFIEPVLEHHDRERLHVFVYADVAQPDSTTERLRDRTESWRSTAALSDDELADLIRQDGIDILVDLAGHTGGNRLSVFARRPAPVQGTWLGYPGTTGLAALDFRISDERADPPGESDGLHSESLVRLSPGFLCFRASDDAPAVAAAPILKNGFPTFGSFNTLPKLSDAVVRAWSRILLACPDARMLIKSPSLSDSQTRDRLTHRFQIAGIREDRLILHGFMSDDRAHLGLYAEVDIALDTFPYNGTTTTCEALWMGVPVVSFVGRRHAGRVGFSLLGQAGLADWCAQDVEGYCELALARAAHPERLAALRGTLRDRLLASPLCDGARFTSSLERAFEKTYNEILGNDLPNT